MSVENIISTLIAVIPVLSVIIVVSRRFFPKVDEYLAPTYVTLKEVDDIIERIRNEFPNNPGLETVDDLLDKLIKELEQAGYTIDKKQKKKMENRMIGKITSKKGWNITWKDGVGKIEFTEKF